MPPPSLQVYDQTSERRGYLQADQKYVAAKLINASSAELKLEQNRETKVLWSEFQKNY